MNLNSQIFFDRLPENENKQAFSNNHHPFWDSSWDNKNAWSWFCNSWSITKCYLNKNVYFTGSEILFSYLLFSWRVQCSRKGNSLNNSGIIKNHEKKWRSSLLNVNLFWMLNQNFLFRFQDSNYIQIKAGLILESVPL